MLLITVLNCLTENSFAQGKSEHKTESNDAPKIYVIKGTREDMELLQYLLRKTKADWETAHPVIAGVAIQLQQQENQNEEVIKNKKQQKK